MEKESQSQHHVTVRPKMRPASVDAKNVVRHLSGPTNGMDKLIRPFFFLFAGIAS